MIELATRHSASDSSSLVSGVANVEPQGLARPMPVR